MKSRIESEPLVVEEIDASAWVRPRRPTPGLELVSVRRGRGTAVLDHCALPYGPGSLFLLGPATEGRFVAAEPTRLGVLRFGEAYLAALAATDAHAAAWQPLRTYALSAARSLPLLPAEQIQLDTLLTLLLASPAQPGPDAVTESLLRAVLTVLGRRVAAEEPAVAPSYAAACVQQVLGYIRRHIAEPEYLRLERLAEEFAYSPQHLSALFKRETGESLHRYVVRYKLQLVEARLRRSTRTVSQIADELAFTDVSHLNKLFKKHYHATPSDYRRHQAGMSVAAV